MELGFLEYCPPSNIAGGADGVRLVAERRAKTARQEMLSAGDMTPDDRREYHQSVSFWRPEFDTLTTVLQAAIATNRGKIGRRAIAVEGPTGSGKSSLVEDVVMALLGRNIVDAQTYRDARGALKEEQPLVWSLAGSSGQRSYANRLMSSLDLPPLPGIDATQLAYVAADEMGRAKTQVAVIDDLHAMAVTGNREQAANFLRTILNRAPATWVFTTLGVHRRTPVLRPGGTHSDIAAQITRRLKTVTLSPLPTSRAGIQMWNKTFSRAVTILKLQNPTPREDLLTLNRSIYESTSGDIALMFQIIRAAAIEAVESTEMLTQELVATAIAEVNDSQQPSTEGGV